MLLLASGLLLTACWEDVPGTPTSTHAQPTPTPIATRTSELIATPTGAPTTTPTPLGTSTPTPVLAPTATGISTRADVVIAVGEGRFLAEVADDPEEREQGLSGREAMGRAEAMWFVYPSEQQASFWMLDMRFPLDIVWVDKDLNVVAVTANVPHPAPGTPPGQLPTYSPGVPIQYVLEINAGLAEELGIGVSARVMLEETTSS